MMSTHPEMQFDDDWAPEVNSGALAVYIRKIREKLDLTQSAMALRMGMSLRAYSDLENGVTTCRLLHMLAAERIALQVAKQLERPGLVPPSVRNDGMIFRRILRPAS